MEQVSSEVKIKAPSVRVKSKSKGLALFDLLLWGAGILAFIGIIAALFPRAMHQIHMVQLGSDITDIQKAAVDWKGRRTNYSGISISELCTSRYLSKSVCGDSEDATNANPWGGDYSIAVNSDLSMVDVSITEIDSDYGQQVIDAMASRTADECPSAGSNGANCSTISLSGSTAKLTIK